MDFCDKNEDAGTPEKPSRVWHMMGLFPTCLALGSTGLVMSLWLRLWCPKYTAFKDWADSSTTWVNRTGNKRTVGGQRKRKVMPSECQESKQFSEGYPQISDKVGYRVVGNAVPVPYFTALLSNVVQALNKAGVQKHTDSSNNALCFGDLSLVTTTKKVPNKGPTLEQCTEVQRTHQACVTKLFVDAKSPTQETQQGRTSFAADPSVGASWHQYEQGWMCLQDEVKLGPGLDHERCTKPECIEPIRKRQLKRKRKTARRRARESTESTKEIAECFHGPAPE